MNNIRDRDYILDKDGNYLKVVGDHHPQDSIISYIKYFPSANGTRVISGHNYGYNSFVSKSFSILKNTSNRFIYSPFHGGILTATPINEIVEYFSCQKKINLIMLHNNKYLHSKPGKILIELLQTMEECMPSSGFSKETDCTVIDLSNWSCDNDDMRYILGFGFKNGIPFYNGYTHVILVDEAQWDSINNGSPTPISAIK